MALVYFAIGSTVFINTVAKYQLRKKIVISIHSFILVPYQKLPQGKRLVLEWDAGLTKTGRTEAIYWLDIDLQVRTGRFICKNDLIVQLNTLIALYNL